MRRKNTQLEQEKEVLKSNLQLGKVILKATSTLNILDSQEQFEGLKKTNAMMEKRKRESMQEIKVLNNDKQNLRNMIHNYEDTVNLS